MHQDLKFIKKEKLFFLCKRIVDVLQKSANSKEIQLYKNIVDPFSALFDASYQGISLSQWLELEKTRQIQKTFQNEIGSFHQQILGSIDGWEDLEKGNIVDIRNNKRKIIAEIKNKFNTTKGNHKIAIYDDLNLLLNNEYKGYTAYYVSILTKKRINKTFIPSDNKTKQKRPENKNIIEIDGKSFYTIVTGDNNALYKLYKIIPEVLSEILNKDNKKIISDPLFDKLFEQAFK
jgi:hypothetical protein